MRFFRRFAPVLLAVFGTVSLLGTGLHLLPGGGHFHAHGHSHPNGHYHAHSHDCHTHEPAGHCHADHSNCEIAPSHVDCAICRFLAIPRALTSAPEVVESGKRYEQVLAAIVLQPALDIERPYGARAPPSLSSSA